MATPPDIASGGLDTRMPPETDPDLARLVTSFNDMADAVQTRLEREARFASDVSHELRSPITALSAAVEVLDGRRDDLPDRSQQALEVVVGQVRRFDQMVMDLLELSRIDAGSTELHREEVDMRRADHPHRPSLRLRRHARSRSTRRCRATVQVDKLRFERILANLLENARRARRRSDPRVVVETAGPQRHPLAVDDAGPAWPEVNGARIFERFARGSAARHGRDGSRAVVGRRACSCPQRRGVGRGPPRRRRTLQVSASRRWTDVRRDWLFLIVASPRADGGLRRAGTPGGQWKGSTDRRPVRPRVDHHDADHDRADDHDDDARPTTDHGPLSTTTTVEMTTTTSAATS